MLMFMFLSQEKIQILKLYKNVPGDDASRRKVWYLGNFFFKSALKMTHVTCFDPRNIVSTCEISNHRWSPRHGQTFKVEYLFIY